MNIVEGAREAKRAQALRALEAANRVRSRRAEIKALIGLGELDVREIVENPPPVLRSMKVAEIIAAAPFIGPSRAKNILQGLGFNERVEFSWLSEERRKMVADEIPEYQPVAKGTSDQHKLVHRARTKPMCFGCGEPIREGRQKCGKCSARVLVEA